MRSGFGRKEGSLSANSIGLSKVEDRSGGFLNLIKSIAGEDIVFLLDARSIKDISIGGTITNWYDSTGEFESYFTDGVNKPAFTLFRNKPAVAFDGTNILATQANIAVLNGVQDLTIIWSQKFNNTGTGFILEWGTNFTSGQSFALGGIGFPAANSRAFIVSQQGSGAYCTNTPNSDYVSNDKPVVLAAVLNRNNPGAGYNKSNKPYVNGKLLEQSEQSNASNLLASMTSGLSSDLSLFLGARSGLTSGWDGYLFSMVMIKRQLTDGEISRISQAMLDRSSIAPREALV